MAVATGSRYLKKNALPHQWCSGCGNGVALGSLLRAFEELGYQNNEVVIVTGIGCWGKADNYLCDERAACNSRPGASLCHGSQGGQPGSSCRGFDG